MTELRGDDVPGGGAILWLGRLVLLALVVVQGWAAWTVTRHDIEMAAGKRAYASGEWEQALSLFEAAREIEESDSQTWAWAGDAALSWHDAVAGQPKAEPILERALAAAWTGYAGSVLRCPTDAWSWSGLAATGIRRMRIEDRRHGLDIARIASRSRGVLDAGYAAALAAASVALELKPSGYQQLDTLGSVYEATGDVERARELYQRSARVMPAPSYHVWGGGRPLVAPLYRAVLEGLFDGLERAPEFEKGIHHGEIGRFALAQGDIETAIAQFQRAEDVAADAYHRYYALYDLASAYEAAERYEEAIDALKRSRDAGFPRAPVSRRLGILAVKLGQFGDACLEWRESLREAPEDAGLRMETARACERAGEGDVAERLLRDGFVAPTDNPTLARALLELYLRSGRRSTAEHLASRWARDYPDHPEFAEWVGSLQRERL